MRNKLSGVYRIFCSANQRSYVGSSSDIQSRLKNHRYELKRGNHHSMKLQGAWNKYGASRFTTTILELAPLEALITREQFWIDFLEAADKSHGFNIKPNAGRTLGYKPTKATREKMRRTMTGRKMSPEHLRNFTLSLKLRPPPSPEARARKAALLSKAATGRKCSEKVKARVSQFQKGRRKSPQECANISKSLTGKTRSREAVARWRESMKKHVDSGNLAQAIRNVWINMSPEERASRTMKMRGPRGKQRPKVLGTHLASSDQPFSA